MRSCTKCGGVNRYGKTPWCKDCMREYQRERRAKLPGKTCRGCSHLVELHGRRGCLHPYCACGAVERQDEGRV